MPNHHVPEPADRPDVEVLVAGAWCAGELRMWTQNDDGTWWAQVRWRPKGSNSRRVDTFPAVAVREGKESGERLPTSRDDV